MELVDVTIEQPLLAHSRVITIGSVYTRLYGPDAALDWGWLAIKRVWFREIRLADGDVYCRNDLPRRSTTEKRTGTRPS
jgi:hypothetical protein